jgi:hypothetical protein
MPDVGPVKLIDWVAGDVVPEAKVTPSGRLPVLIVPVTVLVAASMTVRSLVYK